VRLIVDDLACSRSGRRIFEGISFALGEGQALLVTGRNGAGKSTLLGVLAGRLAIEAGTIRREGAGERTLPECLHLVGHQDGLKTALTAEENLAFARDLLGDPALSPAEALGAVGLAHAAMAPVAYLSAGQRRRVALARLLVAHRPLWLLDEPTSALDTDSRHTLLGLMDGHLARGGLIVVATHQSLDLRNASELRIERAFPSPLRGGGRGWGLPGVEQNGPSPNAIHMQPGGSLAPQEPSGTTPAPRRKGEGI
jgi:heme exporter protein A